MPLDTWVFKKDYFGASGDVRIDAPSGINITPESYVYISVSEFNPEAGRNFLGDAITLIENISPDNGVIYVRFSTPNENNSYQYRFSVTVINFRQS
jgi:hypothetical protein